MSIQKKNSFIQAASVVAKNSHPIIEEYDAVAKALGALMTSELGVLVRVHISFDQSEVQQAIRQMETEGGEA